ncbi:unnamed protein product, partial [Laminaria digitata]
ALVGGAVAGTLWTVAQMLYGLYAANAITYSAIYGSLGAVPLFVVWVYVSWTVALLGATLTFAVQSVRTFEPDRVVSQEEREFVACRIMVAVAAHFEGGGGPLSSDAIVASVLAPPRLARQVLEEMTQAGLLTESSGEDTGYGPGRPLAQLSLADVVAVMRLRSGRPPDKDEADQLCGLVEAELAEATRITQEALSAQSLQDLVAKASTPKTPS